MLAMPEHITAREALQVLQGRSTCDDDWAMAAERGRGGEQLVLATPGYITATQALQVLKTRCTCDDDRAMAAERRRGGEQLVLAIPEHITAREALHTWQREGRCIWCEWLSDSSRAWKGRGWQSQDTLRQQRPSTCGRGRGNAFGVNV